MHLHSIKGSRRRCVGAANRGFTLVEILCVIVILGIASAIIIPQIGTRDDLKAAAAARMIIADLMYSQNLAITRQRKHYIQFVDQQYTVLTRTTDADPLAAITHPISKENYTVSFSANRRGLENVSIDSIDFGGPTILGFDDLGTPFSYDGATITPLTAAATITIKSGNVSLTVSVEPFTGDMGVE